MSELVPIGRFSNVTGLSVKALRNYDDLGLLKPAFVDPRSGYRYYALGQARTAEAIRQLRAVDMPLEDVRELLASDDPDVVRSGLESHRARIEERVAQGQRMLAFLQRLMEREEGIVPYDVQVKELPAQPIVRKREQIMPADIGPAVGRGIGELFGFLGRRGVAPAGPPFVSFESEFDAQSQTPVEIEVGLPVAELVEGEGDVEAAELPGGPVAWTIHRGPYNEIRPAYHALYGWIAEHGHETAGAVREVYMTSPMDVTDPADNVTELDWPIR